MKPTLITKPKLPPAEHILQYLQAVDQSRWYSNRGELVWALETRINALLSTNEHVVVTTSSGTAAIEAAILAVAGRGNADKPLALIPSYTFSATALAVERCGYQAHFVDVDRDSWAMNPISVAKHPHLSKTGLIVPVAPYGRMPDMRAWEDVHAQSGVPVVVDAAAAFEQIVQKQEYVSETIPIAVSFHATKTFSTSEGGGVFWRNDPGQVRIAQVTNFGLLENRECVMAGFNGKLSEYNAAVGLAVLDEWQERTVAYEQVSSNYKNAARGKLGGELIVSPEISSAYALYRVRSENQRQMLQKLLATRRIDSRRWYGDGLHRQAYFAKYPREALPVTEELCVSLLGLPIALDLKKAKVEEVIALIEQSEQKTT